MKKGGTQLQIQIQPQSKPKDKDKAKDRRRSDSSSRKKDGRESQKHKRKTSNSTDAALSRSRSNEKHAPSFSKTALIKQTSSKSKTVLEQSSKAELESESESESESKSKLKFKSKTNIISPGKRKSAFKLYNIDDNDNDKDYEDKNENNKQKPPKFTRTATPPPSPTPLTDLILEKIQVQTFNCTKRSWKKPKEKRQDVKKKDHFKDKEKEETEEKKKSFNLADFASIFARLQENEKGNEKSQHHLVRKKSGLEEPPTNANSKPTPPIGNSQRPLPLSLPISTNDENPALKKSQTSKISIRDTNSNTNANAKKSPSDKENGNPFQLPAFKSKSKSKWIAPHPKNYKTSMIFGMPRQRIEKAIREKRIFEIRGFVNNEVRECLIKRGWVEKPWSAPLQQHNSSDQEPLEKPNTEPLSKKGGKRINSNPDSKSVSLIAETFPYTKLLKDHPANLVWTDGNSRVHWSEIQAAQLVNRHPQSELVAKKNLVEPLQNIQWIGTEKNVSVQMFPRAYRLYVKEERSAFLHDFRLTAVMSFLKWFVTSNESQIKMDENGTLTSKSKTFHRKSEFSSHYTLLLDFALAQLSRYIKIRKHEDLDDEDRHHHHDDDDEFPEDSKNENSDDNNSDQEDEDFDENENKDKEKEKDKAHSKITLKGKKETGKHKKKHVGKNDGKILWNVFFEECYELTHRKGKFKCSPLRQLSYQEKFKYVGEAKSALKEVQKFWPQYHIDGMQNVWIFKPGNGTLGQGISVMDKYDEICKTFLSKNTKKSFWMAQKYIEKPYLISKAKFDIRQWFLITSWHPLTVWIYKKSYLRFSTKVFSLDDLHESIHLTNNSVQSKYDIDPGRGFTIPKENMWTSDAFIAYLRRIGKPTVWKQIIYQGMKQAILGVLLAINESIEHRPGSFHIMGADFMIGDDFQPWLIEINSTPTFAHSTPVTTKLCPLCVQDTLKVILDQNPEKHPNSTAKTGDFELLYQGGVTAPSSQGLLLDGADSENCEFCIKGRKAVPSLTKLEGQEMAPRGVKSKMSTIKSFSVPDFTQGPSRKSSSSDSILIDSKDGAASDTDSDADTETTSTRTKESSDSFLPSGLKRAVEKYLKANNSRKNILK